MPDPDVRLPARAVLPAPRVLLRPRRLPAGHPHGGADHAGGRLMVRPSPPFLVSAPPSAARRRRLTCCCGSLAGVSPGSSTSGTTTAPRRCTSPPGRADPAACRCCWRTAPLSPPSPAPTGRLILSCLICAAWSSVSSCNVSQAAAAHPCTRRRCCRFPGSTSLHLAARSGNLDCIRKLLAWGADRLQRDSAG